MNRPIPNNPILYKCQMSNPLLIRWRNNSQVVIRVNNSQGEWVIRFYRPFIIGLIPVFFFLPDLHSKHHSFTLNTEGPHKVPLSCTLQTGLQVLVYSVCRRERFEVYEPPGPAPQRLTRTFESNHSGSFSPSPTIAVHKRKSAVSLWITLQ